MYLDALRVKTRQDGKSCTKSVYVALRWTLSKSSLGRIKKPFVSTKSFRASLAFLSFSLA
jgi:hypothetical protein